ncbi:MAG: hypothetical protein RI897_4291 [Verrucomicrobiota bacterium]
MRASNSQGEPVEPHSPLSVQLRCTRSPRGALRAARPPTHMHRRITDILIVLITILAPSLGGSTELWAQGILALGLGLVLLLDPPRRLPPRWMLWTAGALLVLPWTAFLPVSWVGEMPYRVLLREEANLELGPFITIQPWLTFEGILLWTLGILWALVLVTRSWQLQRVTLIRLYLLGMVGLALGALTFYTSNSAPEIWVNHGRFGFFENRNQTGNVLALAGILALALGGRDLLRGRLWGWAMLGISIMLGFAVVINGSRPPPRAAAHAGSAGASLPCSACSRSSSPSAAPLSTALSTPVKNHPLS